MLKKIALMSLCSASAFALHYGSLKINDKDLELSGKLDMGQFNKNVEPGTVFVGGRFFHVESSHSSNSLANLDPFYELNFLLKKPIGTTGLQVGMGLKMNYTKNFFSAPLGIEGEYKLPVSKMIPIYVNASAYYAPNALSFNDADNYLEYRAGVDFELVENAWVTFSYTVLNTNYIDSDFTYNESWYIGFKFGF